MSKEIIKLMSDVVSDNFESVDDEALASVTGGCGCGGCCGGPPPPREDV